MPAYDDDFPTCARTHATFQIYPEMIDPAFVTKRLAIEPTAWQRRGEPLPGRPSKIAPLSGWFLRSRGHVTSKDVRRHIDWLLNQLMPRIEEIQELQAAGCRMDIFCSWLSKTGQGGPTVSPLQMARLAELNLELGFDVYGPYETD